MAYLFDYINEVIHTDATQILIQDLLNNIRLAEASEQGVIYGRIASASGKESLGEGVNVGISLQLLGNWQVKFAEGNYIAKIAGGNLVGGPNGDPVAYSAGVQVLLIQSAASTVVVAGDGLNPEQALLLQTAKDEATKARQMQTNKAVISEDGLTVTVYEDNGTTILKQFAISSDKRERLPTI